jgi:hypothetical protein
MLPNFFVAAAPPNPDPFAAAMLRLTQFATAFGIALVFASALLDDMMPIRAGVALGFAIAAMTAAYHTLVLLRGGRPLEGESRFGGLGGGIGGWRLSSTGSLMLLTMIFAAAAAVVANGISRSDREHPPAVGAGTPQHREQPGENPRPLGRTGQ